MVVGLLLLAMHPGLAQHDHCGNPSPKQLRYVESNPASRSAQMNGTMVRLFVHICAFSDGTGAVVTVDNVHEVLGFIENFFEPHGICFILAGINQVNNSDLMSVDDDDEDVLVQYLISDCINIFVHDQLFIDGEGFGGRSWDIPNTYMSITDNHFNEPTDALAAHELGHCMGLYHTHQGGDELVNRSGSCSNCFISGDLLCGTPADPYEDGDLDNHTTNCQYTGSLTDGCDNNYDPDPQNIMSYAPVSCYDYFTDDQGMRMVDMLLDDSDLLECISPANVQFFPFTDEVVFFGWHIFTAENQITVEALNYEVIGTSHVFFGAPATSVMPSVHFAPTTGYVSIKAANPLCD